MDELMLGNPLSWLVLALGAGLAWADYSLLRRTALGAVPLLAAIGGLVGMQVEPFSFAGGNHLAWYALLVYALQALAAYAAARLLLGFLLPSRRAPAP